MDFLHSTIDFFASFFFSMLKYALPTLFILIAVARFTFKFSHKLLSKLEWLSQNKTARTILFSLCAIISIIIAIGFDYQVSILQGIIVGAVSGLVLAALILAVFSFTLEYISKKEE